MGAAGDMGAGQPPNDHLFPLATCTVRRSRQAWRMVKKLLHTRLRVNDLERTVKFYQDALGLEVARRHISPRGAQLAFLRTPNSDEEIEICQMPPGAPPVQVQPDLMHLAFAVDDLEKFADELKKMGYGLSDGPSNTGSGSIIAFIDAPEGYEVELIQRPK
jgi:lactoylglutathione lyase